MDTQILLVKYGQAEGERLSFFLRNGGHDVQRISHPSQARPVILTIMPEPLLIEWAWPEHEPIGMLLALHASMQMRSSSVIALSRHGGARAKITALDAGADDYIVRPRDMDGLHARIRAVLHHRVPHQHDDDILRVDDLRPDPLTLGATTQTEAGPRTIALSPLELRLLYFLVACPQCVHSYTQLLDHAWGSHVSVGERTIDVHVRKPCMTLAGTLCNSLIQTARGGDYRLVAGTGGTTAAHTVEAIGVQPEAVTRKTELPAYRRVPATRSFGPT